MKRLLCIVLAGLLLCVGLTGCTFSGTVDALIAPPKLSVEQEQIYQALQSVAGTNISLKYPKSGDYLSAFIVSDIDADGEDEAIVFYERSVASTDENPLRINVLDQIDGVWRSVHDRGAAGAEIEEVMISRLGGNQRINIIIGYSLVNRAERIAEIYDYRDGTLERTFTKDYSMMDIHDIDKDGALDFILATAHTASQPAGASVYRLGADGNYYASAVTLRAGFTECTQLLYGTSEDDTDCIFIDGATGASTICTEILSAKDGVLRQVYTEAAGEGVSTTRAAGYASADLDGDGIVEIPLGSVFPGYDRVGESEQLTMTSWYTLRGGRLVRKYSGYCSINDSYSFVLPARWEKNVTLKRDSVANELVFYAFDTDLAHSTAELLRICVTADDITIADCLDNGYLLLGAKGGVQYLAKRGNTTQKLCPTVGELISGFYY